MSAAFEVNKQRMSRITSHIEPQEGNQNNTDMLPSYEQHNRELHSAMYQLLHTMAPPMPGFKKQTLTALVTNSFNGQPIVLENGFFIIKE